jgi:hypothetical protein
MSDYEQLFESSVNKFIVWIAALALTIYVIATGAGKPAVIAIVSLDNGHYTSTVKLNEVN